jgi:hypothetical protein
MFQRISGIFGKVNDCLLNKPADHAWIGSTAGNGRRFVVELADCVLEVGPEGIIAEFPALHLLKLKVSPEVVGSIYI